MVRVLSRVPFNLRNEPSNGFASSSSRSNRSPSTNVSTNHITEQPAATDPMHRAYQRVPPSPSVSRSVSASSVQQASISRLSTDELSDPYAEHKFRAQLVPSSKNGQAYGRRGRSRTRQGRLSSESNEVGRLPTLEGIQSVDSGRGDFHEHEGQLLGKFTEAVGPKDGQKSSSGVEITPLSKKENDEVSALTQEFFKLYFNVCLRLKHFQANLKQRSRKTSVMWAC